MAPKKLWIYPLLFGIIGGFLGLVIRYLYTGEVISVPFKFLQHAHSHTMMLGLLFNALILLVWNRYTSTMDQVSVRYFIALQVFVLFIMIAFLFQGYAFFSILFSTLHLWTSYILMIRLWKRLEGEEIILLLIKTGIIFHFLSSLGPYTLGPIMVMGLKSSPWYQQAVFFYLHFQFFGVYFIWILALLFDKAGILLNKKLAYAIVLSLILLYAHSMDFSFNHWMIQFLGGLGSGILFFVLLYLWKIFKHQNTGVKLIFYLLLLISFFNILGSFPYFANLVIHSRFILIAWLHFLFLGLYVPFIWYFLKVSISKSLWSLYLIFILVTELLLLFPAFFSKIQPFSIMDLLFYTYFGVFIIISIIHIIGVINYRRLVAVRK